MFDLTRIAESVRYEGGVSRRLFLSYSAALAALPTLATRVSAAERKVSFAENPFSLGVASGDPEADSVVLWTKLAPKPLEANGGMKPEAVVVAWDLAEDEGMKKIVRTGTAVATPQLAHTVHADANGLQPDRWYWYRFRAGDAVSPIGRTRTLPAADVMPEKLKFAFASCHHYEQGLYTAYEQMAKEDLDLVIFLGDYIYEYPGAEDRVRKHTGPKTTKIKTLADYRERYNQYRSDPLLYKMHALCPWYVTWDDHEFDNNYANDLQEEQRRGAKPADPVDFLVQRAAAYQAYYEMMPLRKRSLPQGPDMFLYRKASFGRLAELFVLDTRQYRTDQPDGDGLKPLSENAMKPTNTLLGKQQRGWLDAGLLESTGVWNVLAQQVMMGAVEFDYRDRKGFSMDQWPGYMYERMALMKFIADRNVPNPVVLTGDIHANYVNDLRVDDRKPETPIVAAEFVGTSISSGGNGQKEYAGLSSLLAKNPCLKFHNRQRGYVRCHVTPTNWKSDYVIVEDVLKAGGAIATKASFVVQAGRPGVQKA
jgi:alkaline phosphatase D